MVITLLFLFLASVPVLIKIILEFISNLSLLWKVNSFIPILILVMLLPIIPGPYRTELYADPWRITKFSALVLFGLLVISIYVFIFKRRKIIMIDFVLFSLVGIISAINSPSPFLTIYKILEVSSLYLIASLILHFLLESQYHNVSCILYELSGNILHLYLLIGALSAILIYPESFPVDSAGIKRLNFSTWWISFSANSVSWLAYIGIFDIILNKRKNDRFFYMYIPLIFLESYIVFITKTRQVFLGFAIISVILILLQKINIRYLVVLYFIIISLIFLFFYSKDIIINYLTRGQSTDLLLSMSGRINIWKKALQSVNNFSILIGKGFYAFQRITLQKEIPYMESITTLDNTWLDIYIGTGILGFLFYTKAFLRFSSYLWNLNSFGKVLSVGIIIRSFFNPTLQYFNHYSIIYILYFISAYAAIEKYSKKLK